jgi:transcriptional regulator with XRE-family HTH domain
MAKCKYDPDTFPMQAKAWAKEGLTEKQIAENLGVSVATFETYKIKHPEFLEALKEGKKPLIIEIENALYVSAKGHIGPDDKYYPPNPTACIFALKNIAKDKWRDKHDIEHSGGVVVHFDKEDEGIL